MRRKNNSVFVDLIEWRYRQRLHAEVEIDRTRSDSDATGCVRQSAIVRRGVTDARCSVRVGALYPTGAGDIARSRFADDERLLLALPVIIQFPN